jgi:glucan biosynthesis protein C
MKLWMKGAAHQSRRNKTPISNMQRKGNIKMDTKAHVRVNYLDWLRVLGILLVFLFHTTRLYNLEDWNVKNSIWYPKLEIWISFSTTFMMPLMFAISGASLFYAVSKGGFLKFFKDKVLRLLVPILVGALTQLSIQAYLNDYTHGKFSGSYFQFLPQYYHLNTIPWLGGGHLWYLWYLFLFTVIFYPLFRWLKGGGRNVLSKLDGWLTKTGVLYFLAFPILLLTLLPKNFPLMGGNGGYPYLTYLVFTLLGFVIVSDERLQDKIRQIRWLSLTIGLALAVGFSFFYNQIANPDEMSWSQVAAGFMRYFGGWISILGFFGLGMQYLTMRTPRLDYANEAVLPFYILHQTVILAIGFFVLQWGIPDLLEWVIVLVISFAVIMAIYELLIRRWNVMRLLFGMKLLSPRPTVGVKKEQLGGAAQAG